MYSVRAHVCRSYLQTSSLYKKLLKKSLGSLASRRTYIPLNLKKVYIIEDIVFILNGIYAKKNLVAKSVSTYFGILMNNLISSRVLFTPKCLSNLRFSFYPIKLKLSKLFLYVINYSERKCNFFEDFHMLRLILKKRH